MSASKKASKKVADSSTETKKKKSKKEEVVEEVVEVKADEARLRLDEAEEMEELEAEKSSRKDSNAEAIASMSGGTEVSPSMKNFRHHPDMENFYRFIYENDLRLEALTILDEVFKEKAEKQVNAPVATATKSGKHR